MNEKIYYYSNKNKLCGVLNKVGSDKRLVVICHARSSNKDSRPTTLLTEFLSSHNINNLRFDFVSCGQSEGDMCDYSVTNMVNNLNDTLEEMQNNYGFQNFILIGCSMGAKIVSLADHNRFNIEKIILWYGSLDYFRGVFNLPSKQEKIAKKQGYYQIGESVKLSYNYFVDERKYSAYKNLCKWDVLKLFIHGTNDPYINYKSSVKVSKKCKNSYLVLIKGGDHGFHDEEHMNLALEKTLDFILK